MRSITSQLGTVKVVQYSRAQLGVPCCTVQPLLYSTVEYRERWYSIAGNKEGLYRPAECSEGKKITAGYSEGLYSTTGYSKGTGCTVLQYIRVW